MDSGPPPTEEQRKLLCEMMYHAFCEIRMLGWHGKVEQAAALADAFHDLPVMMYSPDFRWSWFRRDLQTYQQKYAYQTLNYLADLERIQNLKAEHDDPDR